MSPYFVDGFILEGSRRTSGLRFHFMNLAEDTKDSSIKLLCMSTGIVYFVLMLSRSNKENFEIFSD